MKWPYPSDPAVFPGETEREFYERCRSRRNEFVEAFNRNWVHRVFRVKLQPMETWEEFTRDWSDR